MRSGTAQQIICSTLSKNGSPLTLLTERLPPIITQALTNIISVSFVDETDEICSWYRSVPASPPPALVPDSPPPVPAHSPLLGAVPQIYSPNHFVGTPVPRSYSFTSIRPHSLSSPHSHVRTPLHDPGTDNPLSPHRSLHEGLPLRDAAQPLVTPTLENIQETPYEVDVSHTSPGSTSDEACKLSDPQEAFLLHHYVRSRSRLLDICDPYNHFGRTVPELATKSPLLLNAALAVSAQHLLHTAGYDPLVAEMYHERCVELLIPLLDDLSTVSDAVVAATVLLRNYEQMSSAITGFDCERHLTGTSAFMNSESTCASVGGLRQASFWIFIRQDLDVALSQQRPLRLNLNAYSVEMDLDMPIDDWGWANRIVWLTAEVVAFSFGWEKSRMKYEELKLKTQSWWQRRPESFRPLYIGYGPVFPTIYYSQPWHGKYRPLIHEILSDL